MTTEPAAAELRHLAPLADARARRGFFAEHAELARPATVRMLCREVARLLAVDLAGAERLAGTALWLAEQLADRSSLALARRAAGNVQFHHRDYQGSVSAFEAAIDQLERLGDTGEAAISRSNLVVSLSQLGRYEEALEHAVAARRAFRRTGDKLRLARLENNVAHVLSRQDRFPEALNHYRQAQRLLDEVGLPSDVAMVLRNVAVCHQDLNDLESSLAAYEEARRYCREHGLARIGLEVEYNIAYLYYLRGEYSHAISLFERARRDGESHGDRHHMALCDLDRAEIYLELNLVSEAVRLAERARTGFRELGMEYEVAKALACQALAAERLGEGERTAELLGRARRIFAQQDNRVWTAMIDLYAAVARYAAAQPAQARQLAETAFESFAAAGVPSRTALCEVLLARLALDRGEPGEARRLCAAALEHALAAGRPMLELQAHLVQGQTEEAQGDRAAALAAYGRAEAALERMRGQLAGDELKIAFGDDKRAVYEGLVTLTLESGNDEEQRRAAFTWAEKAKSRSLLDLLAVGAGDLRPVAAGHEELDERIRELRRELNWLYRQLDTEELKGRERSLETVERLQSECRRREDALLRHQRRLASADAELGALEGALVADPEAVAAALPAGGALIEYYVARDVVYGFVLERGRLSARPLAMLGELRELQHQLRFQLEKFRLGADYVHQFSEFLEQTTLALLRGLHDKLLGELLRGLEARHLVVVPHDLLHNLPFHAFHDGERFLGDRFAVSYAPSATVFRLCALRQARPDNRALVLGVPDKRAPMILDEVQTVAARLPRAQLMIGDEATPEVLARLGAGCRIIHLATHGLYRQDNPMFSAIQMGGSRLSLMDLYSMRLQAELVVLSGCGTGLASVRGADELVGLTRGLLYAGARAVLATLWDVNDESTALFMERFYRRLLAAGRPAEALRQAQRELRELFPHPYYWAPFVLVGRPYPEPPAAG